MAKQKNSTVNKSLTVDKEKTRKPIKKKAAIGKISKGFVPVEAEYITVDFGVTPTRTKVSEFIDISEIKAQAEPIGLSKYSDQILPDETSDAEHVTILKSEYDRLLQVEIQHRQLVREKAVIIEEWTVNEKGIRLPASKISITSIDQAMIEISNKLREWVDKSKNSPIPIDPPTSINPEKRKSFLQKLFGL